jgi:soluble lytic murein transglycosylase-like protein
MSIAAIAAVTSRVGQIQGQIDRIAPSSVTFGQALQVAQSTATADVPPGATLVTPQRVQRSASDTPATPIGMMGIPVMLRSGAAASSFLSAPSGPWTAALPAAGQEWAHDIEEAAANAGIDPRLLAAMVWQESGFQPDAVSKSGAIGLSQLMPATAEGLGVDPNNPLENLDGGARYLAWTIREFGSLELGLAAYNAGPGTVRNAGGIPDIPETQAYVPRVLNFYRQLGGTA